MKSFLKKRKVNSLADIIKKYKNSILLRFLIKEGLLNEFIKASLSYYMIDDRINKQSAINHFYRRLRNNHESGAGLACFFNF